MHHITTAPHHTHRMGCRDRHLGAIRNSPNELGDRQSHRIQAVLHDQARTEQRPHSASHSPSTVTASRAAAPRISDDSTALEGTVCCPQSGTQDQTRIACPPAADASPDMLTACAACSTSAFHVSSCFSAAAFPTTSREVLARVRPTFTRRSSATNPMDPRLEERTVEKMATSFSRPCIVPHQGPARVLDVAYECTGESSPQSDPAPAEPRLPSMLARAVPGSHRWS